jgi:hypothetical protein
MQFGGMVALWMLIHARHSSVTAIEYCTRLHFEDWQG